jgi:hypothetical protein
VETNGHHGSVDPAGLWVRLAHASPGRVRVRVDRAVPDAQALTIVEHALSEPSGRYRLQLNPSTRSLLIGFDPASQPVSQVLEAIEQSGVRLERPEEGPPPELPSDRVALGLTIDSVTGHLDQWVSERTHGGADLRTLVPVGFGVLALRELVSGRFVAVPWYALAWYAFDSYWKLRRPNPNEPTNSGGQD